MMPRIGIEWKEWCKQALYRRALARIQEDTSTALELAVKDLQHASKVDPVRASMSRACVSMIHKLTRETMGQSLIALSCIVPCINNHPPSLQSEPSAVFIQQTKM